MPISACVRAEFVRCFDVFHIYILQAYSVASGARRRCMGRGNPRLVGLHCNFYVMCNRRVQDWRPPSLQPLTLPAFDASPSLFSTEIQGDFHLECCILSNVSLTQHCRLEHLTFAWGGGGEGERGSDQEEDSCS